MYIESLQGHLAVCAQPDLPSWAETDKKFWNLISIRENYRRKIDPNGFLEVHSVVFDDVIGLEGLDEDHTYILPEPGHLKKIFSFANSVATEPILIHCWAGVSRSTAVALVLIVRSMHFDGYEKDEIVNESVKLLIEIRPKAEPNPLVLRLGLEQFLDPGEAESLWFDLLHHPVLFAVRFPGASPMELSETSMVNSSESHSPDDPYNLSRFLESQEDSYERALSEIKRGQKCTHWMWYIFPQIDGLASSSAAQRYSIKSIEEARAYLDHPVLGSRLLACAEAVVHIEGRPVSRIFGFPDDLKLRSCATLFAYVAPAGSVFDRLLEKYFGGNRDDKTIHLLGVS